MIEIKFGFLYDTNTYDSGNVVVTPLDDIEAKLNWLLDELPTVDGWLYPPVKKVNAKSISSLSGKKGNGVAYIQENQQALPQTHSMKIQNGDADKANFLILTLGFLFGLYLIPEEHWYLGRVAMQPGKLSSVVSSNRDICIGLSILDDFYDNNPDKKQGMFSAIHWYLLSQSYTNGFEVFDAQYKVLDCLFKISGLEAKYHAHRPVKLAEKYDLVIPEWAMVKNKKSKLSVLRNKLIHEAQYANNPIGYNFPEIPYDFELTLFNNKLIATMLGLKSSYIKSPISRFKMAWDFE